MFSERDRASWTAFHFVMINYLTEADHLALPPRNTQLEGKIDEKGRNLGHRARAAPLLLQQIGSNFPINENNRYKNCTSPPDLNVIQQLIICLR